MFGLGIIGVLLWFVIMIYSYKSGGLWTGNFKIGIYMFFLVLALQFMILSSLFFFSLE